jgi:capsular exopolysaccharide synthesis family protein
MSTFETTLDGALVAAVPVEASPRQGLPLAAIEQFRALARRLDVLRRAGGPRALVVTSPRSGDGRTTTALYTAVALAGRGHRVVLVDLDLRRPALAARHDLAETPGLVEVVRGDAALDQGLRLTPGAPGLTLLPAGEPQPDPAPILHDPRLRELFEALGGAFDFLVGDAPPTLGIADAPCLADLVGAAMLVARAGKTSRRELGAAAATLGGVPIIGCVLNGIERFASIEVRRAAEVVARPQLSTALCRRQATGT